MIPKSWFKQSFDDIYRANQRITRLLMIGLELEAKITRISWQDMQLRVLLHDKTGLSYEAINDLIWERTEE